MLFDELLHLIQITVLNRPYDAVIDLCHFESLCWFDSLSCVLISYFGFNILPASLARSHFNRLQVNYRHSVTLLIFALVFFPVIYLLDFKKDRITSLFPSQRILAKLFIAVSYLQWQFYKNSIDYMDIW